jgi:hypothetical protein
MIHIMWFVIVYFARRYRYSIGKLYSLHSEVRITAVWQRVPAFTMVNFNVLWKGYI